MQKINAVLLITNDGVPVKEAGVAVDRNGRVMEICGAYTDPDVYAEVVIPGFVNAHAHLELSHMAGQIPERENGMTGFIRQLISKRFQMSEAERVRAMIEADELMFQDGIVAVGDISNGPESAVVKAKSKIYYHTFVELLGVDGNRAEEIVSAGIDLAIQFREEYNLPASLSPHASYSMSDELLRLLFTKINYDEPVTIHVNESPDEVVFSLEGKGPMFDFFSDAGFLKPDYHAAGMRPMDRVMQWLPHSNKCQLVHNVMATNAEIHTAVQMHPQLYWCVCYNANQYITGSVPPVYDLFMAGANITIGTDSLASNRQLSVLGELKAIHAMFPGTPFTEMVRWSTYNGARFLGLDHLCGSIKTGMKPGLLSLKNINPAQPVFHADVRVERLC